MKYSGILAWQFLVLIGLAVSCAQEEDPMQAMLVGKWQLREAFRGEQATESLADLYFSFSQGGKMETNLPLPEATGTSDYSVKKGVLTQKQGETELTYQIQSVTDSVLVLTTTLQDFPFRFVLTKETATREY